MTQLTDKIYASPVPQDKTCQPEDMTFSNFYPHASKEVDEIIWIKCNGDSFIQKIPPGSYRFLFTTKAATEEDAKKVVRSSDWHFPDKHIRYVDYKYPYDSDNKQRWGEGFGTAVESLASLLRSKNLDLNKNYALIEELIVMSNDKIIISSSAFYMFLTEKIEFWKEEVKIAGSDDELIIDGFKMLCATKKPFECTIETVKLRQLRGLLGKITDQPLTITFDGFKIEIQYITI